MPLWQRQECACPDAIPVATLKEDSTIEVLARFEDHMFVKTEQGKAGWLYN